MGRALQLACAWASLSLGCGSSGFACEDEAQCGPDGVCESEGWCSFPDEVCSSGRRFGEHAGGGLASRCVPTRDDTSTGPIDPSVASTPSDVTGSPTATSMADEGSTTPISSTTTGPGEETTTTVDDGASSGEPGDDLVVWLDFDDARAPFDDNSGHGNHGECAPPQCPMLEPGVVGSALRFDGVDDRLAVSASEGLSNFDAITIAVWIDVETLPVEVYQDVIAKTLGAASSNSFGIGFPNTSSSVRVVMGDGESVVEIGGLVWPDADWHHVATTWDGMLARLYVDGVMIGETELVALALDDHPVLIGADINGRVENNYFGGLLDDVRIYRRALAEDEIAALLAP